MDRTRNTLSFNEYYYLEEGFKDSVLDKWNELKDLIQRGDFNDKEKLQSLQQEIYNKLKELKKFNSDLFKTIVKTIISDPLTRFTFSQRKGAQTFRVLTVWIMHLLALGGIMAFHGIKEKRRIADGTAVPPSYNEIVNAVNAIPAPSAEREEHQQKATEEVIEHIKWGSFENRKNLVDQIKKFESDSGNPLAAYFDRTQTSIGYGTKAKKGENKLSTETAHNRLIDELEEHEQLVHNILKHIKPTWKLNQDQWNGLIDISFNIGSGKLTELLKHSKDLKSLGDKIKTITHATNPDGSKVKSQNLIKRRQWENTLLGNA